MRELIKRGLIADGEVDERSIEDVAPADLAGFRQCHFFAGIGGWSYALRRAGWPDDRPVWTGSCPCQPFSAAGKGAGFADERHLWPAFGHLVTVCRPVCVFGEQVAGKDGLAWLDLVQTDLQALDYACGAVVFPSAGIGAPHIRERLYWVAYTDDAGSQGRPRMPERAAERTIGAGGMAGGLEHATGDGWQQRRAEPSRWGVGSRCMASGVDDAAGSRHVGPIGGAEANPRHETRLRLSGAGCAVGGVADANGRDASAEGIQRGGQHGQRAQDNGTCQAERPGPVHGFWRDADWLFCRDDKWRPVEPGTFPLAHGLSARVGRLRGYGNAINAEQAATFIETVMEELT